MEPDHPADHPGDPPADLINGRETWSLADIQCGQADLGRRAGLPVPERDQRQEARHRDLERRAGRGRPDHAGGLVNNLWSFVGDGDREDVNVLTVQPCVSCNLPKGWYVSTSPTITANWEADDDHTWTVPLGGGFGRLIRLGKLPVNLQTQAFYNVVKSDDAPTADWTLRLQVQFLFPN